MQNKTPKNKWSPHNKTISALFAEHTQIMRHLRVLLLFWPSVPFRVRHFQTISPKRTNDKHTQTPLKQPRSDEYLELLKIVHSIH